jgi:hypothetical protein
VGGEGVGTSKRGAVAPASRTRTVRSRQARTGTKDSGPLRGRTCVGTRWCGSKAIPNA